MGLSATLSWCSRSSDAWLTSAPTGLDAPRPNTQNRASSTASRSWGSHRGLFDLRQRLFPQILFLQAFSPIIPTHFGIRRMHSHSAPGRLHCLSFLLDPASALLTGVIGFLLASPPTSCVHKHADTAPPLPPLFFTCFLCQHSCPLRLGNTPPDTTFPFTSHFERSALLLPAEERNTTTFHDLRGHWPIGSMKI